MGNKESKESTQLKNVIDCGDQITHRDVNNVMKIITGCERDRQLLQHARLFVTKQEEWLRRDMILSCYGENVEYHFESGDRTNEIVVQLTDTNEIDTTWAKKGWTLWARDAFCTVWKLVKEVIPMVVPHLGGVVGSIMGKTAEIIALDWTK